MSTPMCGHEPPRYSPGLAWGAQPLPRCAMCFLTLTGQLKPPTKADPDRVRTNVLESVIRGGVEAAKVPLDCIYLGKPTGQFDTCKGCRGKSIEVPTFRCAIHGECSTDPARDTNTVRSCRSCNERVAPPVEVETTSGVGGPPRLPTTTPSTTPPPR